MSFYNNKVALVELNNNDLYFIRAIKEEIIMEHFNYEDENSRKETITQEGKDDFDVLIGYDGKLHLIYQDKSNNLKLTLIEDSEIREISLTEDSLPNIYELNIFNIGDIINIIYLILLSEEEKSYRIYHHYLKDEKWNTNVIEDINVVDFLNPIKILNGKDNTMLTYYNKNQICIKELTYENFTWKDSVVMLDTDSKKIYLDMIMYNQSIHLVYSLFRNDNLVVKYESYIYKDNLIFKDRNQFISNEGNGSNPTLIVYMGVLWIVWNESNRILSRFSEDNGETWSKIYFWKESNTSDIVRYKYLSKKAEENTKFEYSFGSISPEIKFIGFGPLDNVEEVPTKKRNYNQFPKL